MNAAGIADGRLAGTGVCAPRCLYKPVNYDEIMIFEVTNPFMLP
jgi:hypothetical protein